MRLTPLQQAGYICWNEVFSSFDWIADDLGQLLDIYIRKVFSKKVKLIRNSENLGLIKSRLKGSRLSTGDVVFFMDSHSEVLPGWYDNYVIYTQIPCVYACIPNSLETFLVRN